MNADRLKRLTAKTDAETVSGFFGEHRWLSNFWLNPISMNGFTAPSAEHHYQAAKAETDEDRALILSLASPGDAKRAGAELGEPTGWRTRRRDIMLDVTRAKYADAELARLLLNTGDRMIIEANDWHDIFWGMCTCSDHGYGGNVLGRIIMKVRTEKRQQLQA